MSGSRAFWLGPGIRTFNASTRLGFVPGFPIAYAVDGTSTSGLFNRLLAEVRPSPGNTMFVFALPHWD